MSTSHLPVYVKWEHSKADGIETGIIMTSFIDKLPEEVLERIIQLACKEPHHYAQFDWFKYTWESAIRQGTILDYIVVSRKWIAPARRILYRNVSLQHAAHAMLFYNVVRSVNPDLGMLVHTLDATRVFSGREGVLGLERFLDALPNVVDLSISAKQLIEMSAYTRWHELRSLDMYGEEPGAWGEGGTGERVEGKLDSHFPKNLTVLNLYGGYSLALDSRPWSGITLPQIKTLTLDRTFRPRPISGWDPIPLEGHLLPRMPKLRCIQASGGQTSGEELIKLIKEVAGKIELLSCASESGDLIGPLLLPHLKNLQNLEFRGRVGFFCTSDLIKMFPASLRWLDIEWNYAMEFGFHLLEALADKRFLPKLQACPRLVYRPGGYNYGPPPRDQARTLLKLAFSAEKSLKERNVFKTASGLRLPSGYCILGAIPCLPFPLRWLSSVPNPVKTLLNELVSEGEFVDND